VRSGRVTPGVRICLDLMEIINQSINQPINQPINQSIDQSIKQSIKQTINRSINRSINQALGVGSLGGDSAAARRLGQKPPYIILIAASRSISFVYSVGSNSDVYYWALGLGRWVGSLGVGSLGGDSAAARRLGQKPPYIILITASSSTTLV
jgi:DNA-binding transcriptional regulator YdaS (Cro superfamily)